MFTNKSIANKFIAPAKINLNLHITGKNDNGYHLLDSLVCFTEFGDELNITLRNDNQFNLSISGNYGDGLSNTDNLIIRGCELIGKQFNDVCGADIELIKNIPISSGIGGGSSDCATTIKALLQLWGKGEPENISELLLSLGADVPVCYYGNSCNMTGVGENITPINLPEFYMIVANPNIEVSTSDIFKEFSKKPRLSNAPSYETITDYNSLVKFIIESHNALQEPAIKTAPQILDLLQQLGNTGSDVVGMSGSGATCFALFENEQSAQVGLEKIDNKYFKVLTKVKS